MAKNLNGHSDVESARGKGTRFKLFLPVVEHVKEISQSTDMAQVEIPGGNETILVVEDEEMLMDILVTSLKQKDTTS